MHFEKMAAETNPPTPALIGLSSHSTLTNIISEQKAGVCYMSFMGENMKKEEKRERKCERKRKKEER
jgi:hypothetical protein